jgi:hypothetical protein
MQHQEVLFSELASIHQKLMIPQWPDLNPRAWLLLWNSQQSAASEVRQLHCDTA